MPDKARISTDKQLKKMEKELTKIYKKSEKEITAEWNAYMKRSSAKIADIQLKYNEVYKNGSKSEIKAIKEELTSAIEAQTLKNDQYRKMVNATAEKITNVNELALKYTNGQMPEIYAINYNAFASQAKKVGVDFNLINAKVVKNLALKNPKLIPYKNIKHKKDYLWNLKKINSSVLQGILQGESIPKISKRLLPIVDNNKASAIRNARTMTTSAENKGRFGSMQDLIDKGVVMQKVWMATHDEVTRISHAEMDGEAVDLDETFSNGLMYPADPAGDPEEVWNCRCSMTTKFIGINDKDGNFKEFNIKGYNPDYKFEQL